MLTTAALASMAPIGAKVVYADPAWTFETFSDKGLGRSPQAHYRCEPTPVICAKWADLGLERHVARDCALVLWATFPMLRDAWAVIDAWGFTYKTGGPWFKMTRSGKQAIGGGFIFRGFAELFLVATRGSPKAKVRNQRNGRIEYVDIAGDLNLGLFEPRREHSRKPDDMVALIETLFDGPGIELYARGAPRPGWHLWGNEVGKFRGAAHA